MSIHLVSIDSDIQKHRHNLLRVGTHTKTELMDWPFLAGQHKLIRVIRAQQFICNIVIGLRAIYVIYDPVQVSPADLFIKLQMESLLEHFLFSRKHTKNIHLGDHQRIKLISYCRLLCGHLICQCRSAGDLSEKTVVSHCSRIPPCPYCINSLCSEAHHVVASQIRLYLHIRYGHILFKGIKTEHIDTLRDYIGKIVHLSVRSAALR